MTEWACEYLASRYKKSGLRIKSHLNLRHLHSLRILQPPGSRPDRSSFEDRIPGEPLRDLESPDLSTDMKASDFGVQDLSQPYLLGNLTLKDFVLPESARVTIPHNQFADGEEFPVIDLANVRTGEDEALRKQTVAKIAIAAETWGFFQIVNHGVPGDLLERNEEHAWSFFAKPVEEKVQIRGSTSNKLDGYKEGIKYGKSWNEGMAMLWPPENVKWFGEQMWPAGEEEDRGARMSADVNKYLEHMEVISRELLAPLMEGLGLPPTCLNQHVSRTADNQSFYRWNHYPTCQRPDLAIGIGAHTDPWVLTILSQDDVGGLQVLKDRQWMGIRPLPGALVVNIGDTLQAWTNGQYKSMYHRVALNSVQPRLSTAFFLSQDDDVIVAPLAELVSEDRPTKYKPFTFYSYREFILMHMKDLGSHDVLSRPHRLDYLATSA